jgi:hypothetical protein
LCFVWGAALFYFYVDSNSPIALKRFLPTPVSVCSGVVFKLQRNLSKGQMIKGRLFV